ncbi:MAG: leucine-rich repeat domain-containing protein [Treponema sp.]|jgi:hypothetical protein|nr:leucine-rich repeat domain-containing protein [Treponema sp.]
MKKFFIFGVLFCIGTALFAQSAESDFETEANVDGSVTITKYVGWDSVVKIPAAIGGKPVTAIGKRAFAKQDKLTGVTIPDSVTSIGAYAFETNKLTSVTFGKALVSIGENAFKDNSLASLTLPDTVKSIGGRAFSHNLLAKIALSGTDTRIGEYAFARNKQLTSVTLGSYFSFHKSSFIQEDDEPWSMEERTNNIGERGKNLFADYVCNDMKAGTYTPDLKYRAPGKDGDFEYIATRWGAALIGYTGESSAIRIPEKVNGLAVKYIDSKTFSGKSVERVLIPNSVTSIGAAAFSEKKLTSLVIPDGVVSIGDGAFYGNQLTSVTLGGGVKTIGANAFANQELTSLVIPDGVVSIGDSAFYGNQLTSVTIGGGVKTIGAESFYNQKLTSLVIPDSVVSIGDRAFSYCKSLTTVSVSPVAGRTWGNGVFVSCDSLDSASLAALKAAGYTGGFRWTYSGDK